MPSMYCVECQCRAFKNLDTEDSDDEGDNYCNNCQTDVQWMSEAAYAQLCRRDRAATQGRRCSEEYKLDQKQQGELLTRRLEEEQRQRVQRQARRSSTEDYHRQLGDALRKMDEDQRRRALKQLQHRDASLHRKVLDVRQQTPRADSRRTSRTELFPNSPTVGPRLEKKLSRSSLLQRNHSPGSQQLSEATVELLLREVPTLGAYVRGLREQLNAARHDAAMLVTQNARLAQENAELLNRNAFLKVKLEALDEPSSPMPEDLARMGTRAFPMPVDTDLEASLREYSFAPPRSPPASVPSDPLSNLTNVSSYTSPAVSVSIPSPYASPKTLLHPSERPASTGFGQFTPSGPPGHPDAGQQGLFAEWTVPGTPSSTPEANSSSDPGDTTILLSKPPTHSFSTRSKPRPASLPLHQGPPSPTR